MEINEKMDLNIKLETMMWKFDGDVFRGGMTERNLFPIHQTC